MIICSGMEGWQSIILRAHLVWLFKAMPLMMHITVFLCGTYGFLQLEFGPDDAVLVSAGYDQSVKVWDCRARTYDALQTMKAFKVCATGHGRSGEIGLKKGKGCTICLVRHLVRSESLCMGSDRLY